MATPDLCRPSLHPPHYHMSSELARNSQLRSQRTHAQRKRFWLDQMSVPLTEMSPSKTQLRFFTKPSRPPLQQMWMFFTARSHFDESHYYRFVFGTCSDLPELHTDSVLLGAVVVAVSKRTGFSDQPSLLITPSTSTGCLLKGGGGRVVCFLPGMMKAAGINSCRFVLVFLCGGES